LKKNALKALQQLVHLTTTTIAHDYRIRSVPV